MKLKDWNSFLQHLDKMGMSDLADRMREQQWPRMVLTQAEQDAILQAQTKVKLTDSLPYVLDTEEAEVTYFQVPTQYRTEIINIKKLAN